MAYGTKYQSNVWDFSGNTYTVNLKKKNYSGSTTTLTNFSTSPLNLNYRGGRDTLDNTIKGSDVDFTFYVHSGENFDELMSSNFKDYQLEILQAQGNTTITSGATTLLQDTSTGAAWSNGGSYMYNLLTNAATTTTTTTTTLAPNSFNGTSSVVGNGNNGTPDHFITSHLTPSRSTIPVNDTSSTTMTPASSLAAGVTDLSFNVTGTTKLFVSLVGGGGMFDNTTLNLYAPTILNNNTTSVEVLYVIPNVAGHNFTLSGTVNVSGNSASNVNLTIEYESGTWTVTVDKPLVSSLTFTTLNALGYITSSTCSGGADDSDSINTTVLPANTLTVSNTTGGLTCTDVKYKLGGTVNINGTTRTNGATWSMGNQSITLSILNTTCSVYPC